MWPRVLLADLSAIARLAALLASLASVSPALATAEPRLWNDWMAGCDQTLKCRALGLPSEQGPASLFFVLDRDSGAAGAITLRLTSTEGLPPGRVTLMVDALPEPGRVTSDADSAVWQGEQALLLARRLATGSTATASVGGKPPVPVSLAGAAAAMLFVDEAQGRVGSKGALIHPGRQTDSTGPVSRPMVMPYRGPRTAPAPATLAAEVRKRGVLKALDCAGSSSTDQVHPLDATTTLVLLECGSGAYNLVQQPYLVRNGDPATAQPVGGGLAEGVINAEFDPRERTLGSITKGRGSGDCGSIYRWAWTGKAFVQVERTLMDECRGVPPEWWITVERSALAIAL